MPETLPHKLYEHVTLRQRLEMLSAAAPGPRFSIAVAEGGLFLEIARECRAFYTTDTRLRFICGRDTAERVIAWNYSRHPPIEAQLEEFELLVAPRQGPFSPPIHLASAIAHLPVDESFDDVSSTEVRRRIAAGEDWTHLVPLPSSRSSPIGTPAPRYPANSGTCFRNTASGNSTPNPAFRGGR